MPNVMLTPADEAIIAKAWDTRNPNWFLDAYFRNSDGGFYVYPGSVRHAQYLESWERQGHPKSFVAESAGMRFEVEPRIGKFDEFVRSEKDRSKYRTDIAFFERRGILLLPWQLEFFRAQADTRIVIGLAATGKTLGIGMLAMFMCATIPNFRFLNVAPTVFQSNLMVREIQARIPHTRFEQKFLLPNRKGFRLKPYATFSFVNGSTAEFMNIARNADNIQSWRGDWLNMDEAGLLSGQDEAGETELAGMLPGMITRLTGERPDGKPRLGLLSLISNAYDNDTLWELYDLGRSAGQKSYWSQLVLHRDNPYITPRQLEAVRREIERHPGMERSWLYGERPVKRGAEFTTEMIESSLSRTQMEQAMQNPNAVIEVTRPGITHYEEPPVMGHVYLIAGDPGTGEPPYRNAPVIQVWDVTNFPTERARMVGFWWGYANGSIEPFLSMFARWVRQYNVPEMFRGYDSTGTQRYMAEAAWSAGEMAVTPLGFDGGKKFEYINCAKVLMSKGLIQMPAGIIGLEQQLRNYRLPDRKLQQDIVSTLCMAAYLMMPLYRDAYPDDSEDPEQTESLARFFRDRSSRESRPIDREAIRSSWSGGVVVRPGVQQEQEEVGVGA